MTSHFNLAFQSGRGPKPDVNELEGLIMQTATRVRMKCVIADAGYDSESNHAFAREQNSLRTINPAKHGRPTNKPAKGRYRRLIQISFNELNYRKRAQVETVMSMIKHRQGSYCRRRTYWSRCRELHLMALTDNTVTLWRVDVFYRAVRYRFW